MNCTCSHCGHSFVAEPAGGHRLLIGDATKSADVTIALGPEKPVLMVTDQPYGVKYDPTWRDDAERNRLGKARSGKVMADHRVDWRAAYALFAGDVAYIWHGHLHAGLVGEGLVDVGFVLRMPIIWNKTVMALGRGDYHWKHEACWYAVRLGKSSGWQGGRKQTSVWDMASPAHIMGGSKEEKTAHPTQKPIEAMRRPIENNTSAGAAVYDPFVGSGTTIIAGEVTGRRVVALELDPVYAQMSIERWEKFTGQRAILADPGVTLDEVGRARRKGRAKAAT